MATVRIPIRTAPEVVWDLTPTPLSTTWQTWTTTTTNYRITTGNTATWNRWINSTTTTGATIHYDTNYTWTQWDGLAHEAVRYPVHEPYVPTQEELDAAQRRREEESARRLAAQRQLAFAEDRAMELLRSLLTEEQAAQVEHNGEIWVDGSAGGIYVIETGAGRVHGNIRAVDAHGCVLGRLCVQPSMYDGGGAMPIADGFVGQLLAIRHNERALLEKANWSGQRACQQPNVPILRAA